MSNKLNKNIPKYLIDIESEKRSKIFYKQGIPLSPSDIPADKPASQPEPDSTSQPKRNKPKIILEYTKLLTLWLNQNYPFLFQQEIFDLLNIKSGSKISKQKKHLLTNKYIIEHKLQIGKTNSSVWEPTDKAYKLIGLKKPIWKSKGGYLHQFCAFHLKKRGIKKGFSVEIEYMLDNGKSVDLLYRNDTEIIFIEIATSYPLEKEISNIIKDFSSDLIPDRLIMAVQNGKMKKQLEQLIKTDNRITEYSDKIEVYLAGNLIFQNKG